MKKMNQYHALLKESKLFSAEIHKLAEGQLDILIPDADRFELSDLANDINDISCVLNQYISEISRILSHLSIGDLTVSVSKDVTFGGNFYPIKTALNRMSLSLNTIFHQLENTLSMVQDMCNNSTNQSCEIAQNAALQADQIHQITNLMNEISAKTAENCSSIDKITSSIMDAEAESQHGAENIDKMVTAMKNMNISTNNIKEIVTLIENISRQTKLLSLNASIEAARAGENGKGFSVVAKEIGQLAGQTSQAVQKTTSLVKENLENAEKCENISYETAVEFTSIQKSIQQAALEGDLIKRSAQKQSDAINSIHLIIEHLLDMGKENAKRAEENVEENHLLLAKTAELEKLLLMFTLDGQENLKLIAPDQLRAAAENFLYTQSMSLPVPASLDTVLTESIMQVDYAECVYVMDETGVQLSHTIMHPAMEEFLHNGFSPAQPGFNHSKKRYFTGAISKAGEIFESYEYISSATGGLCKTFSMVCNTPNGNLVLCIDMMCMKNA